MNLQSFKSLIFFATFQLYAIGGFDGEHRLTSMECYHPENNAWTIMPSMKSSRSGSGVAVLNQYIYVVGGFDGSRQLASVERFDTDKHIWETVNSMKTARSALSVNVIDGKLYAMVFFFIVILPTCLKTCFILGRL